MQLVKPSIKHVDVTSDPMKAIEAAGRTCWKSGDKIGEGTAEKFVKMVMDKKHDAVLEHGNFILSVSERIYKKILLIKDRQYIRMSNCISSNDWLISGNPRAFRDFCLRPDISSKIQRALAVVLSRHTPILFDDTIRYTNHLAYLDTDAIGTVDLFENVNNLSRSERLTHQVLSYRIVCNRGVTHEIVRHRLFSYAQESTRYCNYKGGVTFIIPCWIEGIAEGTYDISWENKMGRCQGRCQGPLNDGDFVSKGAHRWFWSKVLAERDYIRSLEDGWIPQQARDNLPIGVKTEIVVTGNLQEWMHMMSLRCSPKAHPQMREIALMVLKDLHTRIPIIFDSLWELYGNEIS